ncbi:hypothetical protein J1N35_029025 [Gossypium stocksii]|uniref:Uncharacterized protein n=1 Tax=Gossypium stocksii TaxID=47602 RepID=A0A9D3UXA8_9ROSI|nr:hypothetical protein J1N35_029025 [Gossypium stocksii]
MASPVHAVIIIVFFSCGGFFLAFLAVTLFCFLKRKKKVEETDTVHVDEHLKVKEATVPGSHRPHDGILDIEDDVHVAEEIVKTKKVERGSRLEENLKTEKAASSSDHKL